MCVPACVTNRTNDPHMLRHPRYHEHSFSTHDSLGEWTARHASQGPGRTPCRGLRISSPDSSPLSSELSDKRIDAWQAWLHCMEQQWQSSQSASSTLAGQPGERWYRRRRSLLDLIEFSKCVDVEELSSRYNPLILTCILLLISGPATPEIRPRPRDPRKHHFSTTVS
jgi:hypothetical protein